MQYKLIALAILVSNSAVAGVYKCVDTEGKTGYQSKPCATGERTVEINFKTGEAIDKSSELKRQASEIEKQNLKEKAKFDFQQQKRQLIVDANIEAEKNQMLIKSNTNQYTAYAIPPYEPDNLSSLVKKFEDRLPDIERLRRLAAQKVLASGQCERVESSELNINSTRERLVLLVNCSRGKGIYINEDELK